MDSDLVSVFKRFGLDPADSIRFQKHNLAIGQNGSGKTRFLKAIEEYYHKNPPENTEVITLYFPEISSFYSQEDAQVDEEPTAELESAIFSGELLNFEDFLKLAQRDTVTLLDDLFTYMQIRAQRMRRQYQDDFDLLNKKLRTFLGWELENKLTNREIRGIKLFNNQQERKLPIVEMLTAFSPGELMIFYFCLFLFYLEHVRQSKLILIIDEPEQHLHPKVLVELIRVIKNTVSVSQLWIASHSLFLLPLFQFEQLVYIKQNKILTLNRNTYKDVYNDLVGLENVDMYDLLQSVECWSYYQFIAENFLLPTSKDTVNNHDEQFRKLLNSLRAKKSSRPLDLLDFGAGKLRIWECFKLEVPDAAARAEILRYSAYEPYPEDDFVCPSDVSFYTKVGDMPRSHYDVVVLMNVLHEIDPKAWPYTLKVIYHLLREDGIVVFLEVLCLSKGEQPYGNAGYLLLQGPETKALFPHATPVSIHEKDKSNCWIIPRKDLETITRGMVADTIGLLEDNCERQLEQLDQQRIKLAQNSNTLERTEIKTTARQYAFLAQQYINAHIAYKRLCPPDDGSSSHVSAPAKLRPIDFK